MRIEVLTMVTTMVATFRELVVRASRTEVERVLALDKSAFTLQTIGI